MQEAIAVHDASAIAEGKSDSIEQVVREIVEFTGVQTPALLQSDAPVLADEVLDDKPDEFYCVGLIGGKEVGKSAMVNAITGRKVTRVSSHGAGTERVIAYAHVSKEQAVRLLLDKEVPGQFQIVGHEIPELTRQVLLDLPDIDSHWESHLPLTRKMLRHMLFPIWIVSIEKYADRYMLELLEKVAAGNSASNFRFVINKTDQLGNDEKAMADLRADYAARIRRTLGIDTPKIWMVSAISPGRYEIDSLKQELGRQKSESELSHSIQLADKQRHQSLSSWIQTQNLAERADRLSRLTRAAEDLLRARAGDELIERTAPAIVHDPALRANLAERVLERRIIRWPLVSLVHTLLAPILAMATALVRGQPGGESSLIDMHLRIGTATVSSAIQGVFAHLRQTSASVADLYQNRRLWEDMPADLAADELRLSLELTLERQRKEAIQRLGGSDNVLAMFGRWLLTIGALLWFPIVQPILSILLDEQSGGLTIQWGLLVRASVDVLSAQYLLHNAVFLLVWYLVLWLAIRWSVHKQVARLLDRWETGAGTADLDLSAQIIRWMDDLLRPIRQAEERVRRLANRANICIAAASRESSSED